MQKFWIFASLYIEITKTLQSLCVGYKPTTHIMNCI